MSVCVHTIIVSLVLAIVGLGYGNDKQKMPLLHYGLCNEISCRITLSIICVCVCVCVCVVCQMENIGQFLSSCYDYGLDKNDVFQTVDLYDNTNIPQVSYL